MESYQRQDDLDLVGTYEVTGRDAGERRQLPIRTPTAVRIGQFWG
jgi:hypothetical protein